MTLLWLTLQLAFWLACMLAVVTAAAAIILGPPVYAFVLIRRHFNKKEGRRPNRPSRSSILRVLLLTADRTPRRRHG